MINFRRSLIELEDQNVQNSIEISKRQIQLVQHPDESEESSEAHTEVEQLRKAITKNNQVKKNIAKRLRANEKEADLVRQELEEKITGEDRRELMELQYQVGRLELENMELEQHRIVHESILKGKDLTIQKLKLQLALRDKIISRQQELLTEYGCAVTEDKHLSLVDTVLLNDTAVPISPPKLMIQNEHPFQEKILQPFRYSPKPRTPQRSTRQKNIEDDFVPVLPAKSPSNGRESRSLLTFSVQKLQSNDENVECSEDFANALGNIRNDSVLNSRDRKAVEEGEWSEVQPNDDVDVTSMGIFGEPKNIHKSRARKLKKGSRKASVHPTNYEEENAEPVAVQHPPRLEYEERQPYRPGFRKQSSLPAPRPMLTHQRSNDNSVVNSDLGDLEIEPPLIQVNGKSQSYSTRENQKNSARLTSMEKLSSIYHGNDSEDDGRSRRAGGIKPSYLPYDMMLQLPKKSPRGRLVVEKSEKTKAISPRPIDAQHSLAVRMGGLHFLAPRGGIQKAKDYK